MAFNGNKTREWKSGSTPETGTPALGELFNAEFDRLYENDNHLNTNKVNNSDIDIDGALTANSDAKIPSQKAVKSYVDLESRLSSAPSLDIGSADVVLTDEQVKNRVLTLTGALAGNRIVTFPLWKREWIVINQTTGRYKITVGGATGDIVILDGGDTYIYNIFCDGNKFYCLNPKRIPRPVWTSPVLVGSGLSISGIGLPALAALNNTDVAFIDPTLDSLRCYHFNGSTWVLSGSGLSISGVGGMSFPPALAALNGNTVAFIDSTNMSLRCYQFNGSTWVLVGSGLSISGVGFPALAALNETDVAFIDAGNKSLRCYRFDGNAWSLVGSGHGFVNTSNPSITALNETDVVLYSSTSDYISVWRFDGVNWSSVGSSLQVGDVSYASIAALNREDIIILDSTGLFQCYRFDGNVWSLVGSYFAVSGIGTPALAALSGTDVAFVDDTLESLRLYRFGMALENPYHP